MKRVLLTIVALVFAVGITSAQNYMVVNSEKVFKSLADYNKALEQIESLSESYQKQVDTKFAEVENLYNAYMSRKSSLSAGERQQWEQTILSKESEATTLQETLFGAEGELMKRRMELIQPVQQRVFATLESLAKQYGYDLVIDISANPLVLYYSNKVDFTDKIIESLKR